MRPLPTTLGSKPSVCLWETCAQAGQSMLLAAVLAVEAGQSDVQMLTVGALTLWEDAGWASASLVSKLGMQI